MAIPAGAVWQVFGTGVTGGAGADTNGGLFVYGASGTDYSKQASPQANATDGGSVGTTAFTSASALFTSAMVGNGINIAGSYYEVATYVSATSITTDRATTTGTGITWAVGGALANMATALTNMVTGNAISCGGAFTLSAALALSTTGSVPSNTQYYNRIVGFNLVPGDGGQAVFTQGSSGSYGFNITTTGWEISNITVNGASQTGSYGFTFGSSYCVLHNCSVKNFATYGVRMNNAPLSMDNVEITGGGSSANAGIYCIAPGSYLSAHSCNIHDNSCPGVILTGSTQYSQLYNCLITKNTGASSDGMNITWGTTVINCTIDGNGRDGIRSTSGYNIECLWKNNILSNNGGYGINFTVGAVPYMYNYDGNVYYNNTSGNTYNISSTLVGDGYTNTLDITASTTPALTTSPYVNQSASNYTLNSTSGGGASLTGYAQPGLIQGNTNAGYNSFGAYQPNVTTTTTNIIVNQNMIGAQE